MPIHAAIYRSSHPEVQLAWEKQRAHATGWRDDLQDFCTKWGMDPDTARSMIQPDRALLMGFRLPRSQSPADGWRWDSASRNWVPALRTELGKQINSDLKTLGPEFGIRYYLDRVGMPSSFSGGGARRWSGVKQILDTTWVQWNWEIDIDDPRWERVKLSDYCLMVESGEDPLFFDEENEDDD
jgi:hypothetical protein